MKNNIDKTKEVFMGKCVFCEVDNAIVNTSQSDYDIFCNCPNCARFEYFEGDVNAHKDKKHLIAGYLYEFNRNRKEIRSIDCKEILNDVFMPNTPMQRLDRLLVNLYKASDKFGEIFFVGVGYRPDTNNPNISNKITGIGLGNMTEAILNPRNYPISIAYARNFFETKSMLESLEDLGYLKPKEKQGFIITPKGFEKAEQILNSNINSKIVFVAMWFPNKDDKDKE